MSISLFEKALLSKIFSGFKSAEGPKKVQMFYFLHTHKNKKNRLYNINETAVVFSDCGRFIMNSVDGDLLILIISD